MTKLEQARTALRSLTEEYVILCEAADGPDLYFDARYDDLWSKCSYPPLLALRAWAREITRERLYDTAIFWSYAPAVLAAAEDEARRTTK